MSEDNRLTIINEKMKKAKSKTVMFYFVLVYYVEKALLWDTSTVTRPMPMFEDNRLITMDKKKN